VLAEGDRDEQLAVARRYGHDPESLARLEARRDWAQQVYEARREFAKHRALDEMLVNLDEMRDLAQDSDKLNDKLSLHGALTRIADIDRPQVAATPGGTGFVLTINLPGANSVQLGAVEPVTIDNELPPTPAYLGAPEAVAAPDSLLDDESEEQA
jgi:hypothetical protein